MKNKNLNDAKSVKNDEFYTLYDDIENELINYKDYLKDKVIYCNCDSDESNFVKFLKNVKNDWQIKEVIHSCIKDDGSSGFESEESIELLKRCDVVITNPPFSLFKEFISFIFEYNKSFIVVSSITSYTYKQMFPKILNNEIRFGYNTIKQFIGSDGKLHKFGNICWFTNFDVNKENEWLNNNIKYDASNYKKFDNFDAINVNKVSEIPDDYYDAMGVPLLFAEKLNRNQFEILGLSNTTRGNLPNDIAKTTVTSYVDGKKTYAKLFIKRK